MKMSLNVLAILIFLVFGCKNSTDSGNVSNSKLQQDKIAIVSKNVTALTPLSISNYFIPCGWYGCGQSGAQAIQINTNWQDRPSSGKSCIRVEFSSCPLGGGIYWMNKQDGNNCNWGNFPGEDFSSKGFTQVTVKLRGESGKEKLKIITGGVKSDQYPNKDSYEVYDFVTLTTRWKFFTLDISNQSLKSVIGGFGIYASLSDHPNGLIFYIDDLQFE